jgi:hypothetical protein
LNPTGRLRSLLMLVPSPPPEPSRFAAEIARTDAKAEVRLTVTGGTEHTREAFWLALLAFLTEYEVRER